MHVGTPPFIVIEKEKGGADTARSERQWRRLPPHLQAKVLRARKDRRFEDGPCIWLDLETKLCRHYDHRPKVCRTFEVGGESCLRLRSEWGLNVLEGLAGNWTRWRKFAEDRRPEGLNDLLRKVTNLFGKLEEAVAFERQELPGEEKP
jgi:Fe-S-cluster containining protein